MTIGTKYYGVSGCKITMAQPVGGRWMIQNVLIPKHGGVEMTEELALQIANHIQDRIEREGQWSAVLCRDNETKRYVSQINGQHIVRDSRGRFAPHAAEEFSAEYVGYNPYDDSGYPRISKRTMKGWDITKYDIYGGDWFIYDLRKGDNYIRVQKTPKRRNRTGIPYEGYNPTFARKQELKELEQMKREISMKQSAILSDLAPYVWNNPQFGQMTYFSSLDSVLDWFDDEISQGSTFDDTDNFNKPDPFNAEEFGAESPQLSWNLKQPVEVGDEGMFEGGEIRITSIEDNSGDGRQNVYFFTYLDEEGNSDGFTHTSGERRFLNQFTMFPREWLESDLFEAQRIQYDYVVHREPRGTEVDDEGNRIPNPRGGWFTSAPNRRDAENFDAEQVQFDVLKGKPSEGGSDYGEYISIHDSYEEAQEVAKRIRKNLADDEEVYIIEEVFDDETFDSISSTKLMKIGKSPIIEASTDRYMSAEDFEADGEEGMKRYVLKNPDDYLIMMDELKSNPVLADWKINILESHFPKTGRTWKKNGEYPEVLFGSDSMLIRYPSIFGAYRSRLLQREGRPLFPSSSELPKNIQRKIFDDGDERELIYIVNDDFKGYEGAGVMYADPAIEAHSLVKGKEEGQVIETLYLNKDGKRTLYTGYPSYPPKNQMIIPDRFQKIMNDIGTKDFLMFNVSPMVIVPEIAFENLREGMVLKLNQNQTGGTPVDVGKIVKIEPKGEGHYDITYQLRDGRLKTREYDEGDDRLKFPGEGFNPVIEYDEQADKYYISTNMKEDMRYLSEDEGEEFESPASGGHDRTNRFYNTCSSQAFTVLGRKLYYRCSHIGTFTGASGSYNKGGLNTYSGGQRGLRTATNFSDFPIMNTMAEISQQMKPSSIGDWREVISATNQIMASNRPKRKRRN